MELKDILNDLNIVFACKIKNVSSLKELETLRVKYLGKNGLYTRLNSAVWKNNIDLDKLSVDVYNELVEINGR